MCEGFLVSGVRNLFLGKQALAKCVTQTVTHLSRYKIGILFKIFPDCVIRVKTLYACFFDQFTSQTGNALFRWFSGTKMGEVPRGETQAEKTKSSSW